MRDHVNEFLNATREVAPSRGDVSPMIVRSAIVCESGLCLSVQASAGHYCTPKNNEGPYVTVEVAYPTRPVDSLLPYVSPDCDDKDATECVYGFVPVDVVNQVIENNGGIRHVS